MKEYLVRFTKTDGDYDKAWTYADSKEQAADKIKHEYWNVARIDLVQEL